MGLPIGPDTSLILAESVLKAADDELRATMGSKLRGFRFIDDYEFACGSLRETEEVLAALEASLAKYELRINAGKTHVAETPRALMAEWTAELRDLRPRGGMKREGNVLLRYVSRALELAALHPHDSVLKFAAADLRSYTPSLLSTWPLLHTALLSFAAAESASLPVVIERLVHDAEQGHAPRPSNLADSLTALFERHSVAGHMSEVAWSLWAALVLDVKLSPTGDAMRGLAESGDNVSALLALDAEQRSLIPPMPNAWDDLMNADELDGSSWLLAYEANLKGWGAAAGKADYVAPHQWFGPLKQSGASFYDVAATMAGASPRVVAAAPVPGGSVFGFYA